MSTKQSQEIKKIIHCTDLTKEYQFGSEVIHALQEIDLEISEGEFIAIMGKSGSGKTTLINILAGLLSATSGNVVINGQSLMGMSSDQLSLLRRETIGIVFQMFNLHPGLTVLENVELPLLFNEINKDKRRAVAREILTFLQLEDYTENYPDELSGGEKQRVAIARALINEPKILLADEPTGNLNSLLAKEIITLFKKINQEKGLTIIFVTHDESLVDDDMRLVKLKDGKLVN
ncbi:MAG TPA: ABC transporter ATP-binding protein [candidate division Zixibacteria bacterium]|nr:ABC transporter ATP-binding protein [candidate division Zixibacteria bacterium]